MKNHSESVSLTPNTSSERIGPIRKIIAIGSLSTIALTGCATSESEASPQQGSVTTANFELDSSDTCNTIDQLKERREQVDAVLEAVQEVDPSATRSQVFEFVESDCLTSTASVADAWAEFNKGPGFATEVEKTRESWNIDQESLVQLAKMYEEKGGEKAHGDPEFESLKAQVRDKFLVNMPKDVIRPAHERTGSGDILNWYSAVSQLHSDYYSDVYREQRIRNVNENKGQSDPEFEKDYTALKGVEVALFNGISDKLNVRDGVYMFHVMDSDGKNDSKLPSVHREFIEATTENTADGSLMTVIRNEVTVEGKPPIVVVNRFDWNKDTQYWDLTAELSADETIGTSLR